MRYPNRYMIKRGVGMWKTVMEILERFKEEERGRGGVMEEFSAESLKLKPEHLKNLRPVETSAVKPKRQKREFVQITREQSERLDKAKNIATWKVFLHLMFLNWKSPGRTIRLANGALGEKGCRPTRKTPRSTRVEEAWPHQD